MQVIAYITDNYCNKNELFMLEAKLAEFNFNTKILHYNKINNISQQALTINYLMNNLNKNSILLCMNNLMLTNGFLYIKADGYHIFTSDNGVTSILRKLRNPVDFKVFRLKKEHLEDLEKIWQLNFLSVITVLKGKLSNFFEETDYYKEKYLSNPQIRTTGFNAKVLFVKENTNALVFNLKKEDFEEKLKKFSSFKIIFNANNLEFDKIDENIYLTKKEGEPYVCFNEFDLLEVGLYRGNITQVYSLYENTVVKVEFY